MNRESDRQVWVETDKIRSVWGQKIQVIEAWQSDFGTLTIHRLPPLPAEQPPILELSPTQALVAGAAVLATQNPVTPRRSLFAWFK